MTSVIKTGLDHDAQAPKVEVIDDIRLTGLPHYIGDEDHPITTSPEYGGIRRDGQLMHVAKRKIDQLRKEGEMLPPSSRTIYREQDGKLLPVTRVDGKRISGESGRQRKRRMKLERRELRGE